MKIARLSFLSIMIVLLCSVPTYAGPCFSKVIVFGDSNVDSGVQQEFSLYNITDKQIPGAPNVGGRSCNGPVVVEYAADILGAPLEGYGVGGATTGEGNIVFDLLPFLPIDPDSVDMEKLEFSGVLSQLQLFEDSLKKKKSDKRALYILWAGSNDLFGATEDNLTDRINNALNNIETALIKLNELGAKYILVATRTIRPEYYDDNNVNGVLFNARLRIRVQQLDEELKSKIEIFEAFDLISDMTYNPDYYGFEETTDRCASDNECNSNQTIAETYITWDDAHKTTRVHEIMAEALVCQVLNMKGNRGRCSCRN